MKVLSIDYKKTIRPNSSGTGASCPNKYSVKLDDGSVHDLWVDIWYLPIESIKNTFIQAFKEKFGKTCNNIDEAYHMYVKLICDGKSCPWSEEEILRAKLKQV